mgnify:CR=1 FL=1
MEHDREVDDETLMGIAIDYVRDCIETLGDDIAEILDDRTDGHWGDGDLGELYQIKDKIINNLLDNLH